MPDNMWDFIVYLLSKFYVKGKAVGVTGGGGGG